MLIEIVRTRHPAVSHSGGTDCPSSVRCRIGKAATGEYRRTELACGFSPYIRKGTIADVCLCDRQFAYCILADERSVYLRVRLALLTDFSLCSIPSARTCLLLAQHTHRRSCGRIQSDALCCHRERPSFLCQQRPSDLLLPVSVEVHLLASHRSAKNRRGTIR